MTDFKDPGVLIDGELSLVVRNLVPADLIKGYSPAYAFEMRYAARRAGDIRLRLGDDEPLVKYAGQIGFNVDPEFRGRHFAARSVRLLLPLARAHGIDPVWITCNPENIASRRSCELAGGELIEIVDIPRDCEMFKKGDRKKCRYRIPAHPKAQMV